MKLFLTVHGLNYIRLVQVRAPEVWIASKTVKVKVIVPDVDLQYADADAVISPIADEVMLSDKMISELGLVPEDVGRGHWRFMWEPREKVRKSEPRSIGDDC